MNRFLCIHGHFYQPPRENPWLEYVEIQDSAYPFHDWNERITAECYAANAASRILDGRYRIKDIVSNYAKISFNIGPTLLSWLEEHSPEVYDAILEADRQSLKWRGGHGAALAQAYSHMIMPLASERDKRTQVLWGIRDFEYRFKRLPEGMWLPETAVDLATLEELAGAGIKFTVLAPNQAAKVRRIGEEKWQDVSDSTVDPKRPYLVNLPSGKTIAVFFYDGPISRAVAFERLLESGEGFANRLLSGFSDNDEQPELLHIATDGESYGHHHHFGDMALAYALHYIEEEGLARITNYGEYLEEHPPEYEAGIFEFSSWSCVHGVERWRSDCGCNSGGKPGWTQKWRAPLREALDGLRDSIAAGYEKEGAEYLADPWAARDDYISVILDRSEESVEDFITRNAARALLPQEESRVLKLLEMQRHAMLMYTSCGWFFDEISGIETVQIIQYAARAVQLAQELFGDSHEERFREKLAEAPSNIKKLKNGAGVYDQHVKPATVDPSKVVAHYAISSLFETYPEEAEIFCYRLLSEDRRHLEAGRAQLLVGRSQVVSEITRETLAARYVAFTLGTHHIHCGVSPIEEQQDYLALRDELARTFEDGDFVGIVRIMDREFQQNTYSLRTLFKDRQREVLELLLHETTEGFETQYRSIYENNRLLMDFLRESGIPVPRTFLSAAEFTTNRDVLEEIGGSLDTVRLEQVFEEMEKWGLKLDHERIQFDFAHRLEQEMQNLSVEPENQNTMDLLISSLKVAERFSIQLNLWSIQNLYYRMARLLYPEMHERSYSDNHASYWVERFQELGALLSFNLKALMAGLGVEDAAGVEALADEKPEESGALKLAVTSEPSLPMQSPEMEEMEEMEEKKEEDR